MSGYVLALDQGTSSSRAMVFGGGAEPLSQASEPFAQHHPRPGWVEHDPEDLWRTTLSTARQALRRAGIEAAQVAAVGVANQRETVVLWDRATGRAVHNAIVWQDRRTAAACAALEAAGHLPLVQARTGLLLDPYFSATKLAWLLDTVDGARDAAAAGRLAFGTVDTFLLWRLTGGAVHATDATNASRTLLLDIHTGQWDPALLEVFRIPGSVLPEVRDTSGPFGTALAAHLGAALPVRAMVGDQQGALAGQGCFAPGMIKSTYGTGCFALLHTGARAVASSHRLLTTVALQRGGRRTYALEGSIFVAGAAVQWLRDGLGIIGHAAETDALAAAADPALEVYLVPAFVGLGAPYWDPEARGVITGLTRDAGRAELARAALASVAHQTEDLVEAMRADLREAGLEPAAGALRVDGGMSASDWTMQFLADTLAMPVDRPASLETTALGAAYLAGLDAGIYPEPEAFAAAWRMERRFEPDGDAAGRARRRLGWRDAVRRARGAPPDRLGAAEGDGGLRDAASG